MHHCSQFGRLIHLSRMEKLRNLRNLSRLNRLNQLRNLRNLKFLKFLGPPPWVGGGQPGPAEPGLSSLRWPRPSLTRALRYALAAA